MSQALDVYRVAFHPGHPKLAWAHEGIAAIYMKNEQFAEAGQHLDLALEIRRGAQAGSDGHELFNKQIEALEIAKVCPMSTPPLFP